LDLDGEYRDRDEWEHGEQLVRRFERKHLKRRESSQKAGSDRDDKVPKSGSWRISQRLIATPTIPISATKIHAPGQSNVPAGQNTARQ
jgi:hypothetical protein